MEILIPLIIWSVIAIFLLRLVGAWMLRINEIIKLQKDILEELKKNNSNHN